MSAMNPCSGWRDCAAAAPREARCRRPGLSRRAHASAITRIGVALAVLLAVALMAYGERWLLEEAPGQTIDAAIASCVVDIVYPGTGTAAACTDPSSGITRGNAL